MDYKTGPLHQTSPSAECWRSTPNFWGWAKLRAGRRPQSHRPPRPVRHRRHWRVLPLDEARASTCCSPTPRPIPSASAMTGLSGGGWQTALLAAPRRARQSHRPGRRSLSRLAAPGLHRGHWRPRAMSGPTSVQSPITTHSPRSLRRDRPCSSTTATTTAASKRGGRANPSTKPIRPVFALLDARDNIALHGQHRPRHPQLRARTTAANSTNFSTNIGDWKRQTPTCPIATNCKPKKPSQSAYPPTTPLCSPSRRQLLAKSEIAKEKAHSPVTARQNTHLITQAAAVEKSIPTDGWPPSKAQRRHHPTLPTAPRRYLDPAADRIHAAAPPRH